jgi:hypothetical protein
LIRWIGQITDHERTSPSTRVAPPAPPRAAAPGPGHSHEQVALARVGARVLRDQCIGCDGRGARKLGGGLVEVGGDPECLVAEGPLLPVRRAAGRGLDDPAKDVLETIARRPEPAEDAPVLGGRHEAQAVGARLWREPDDRIPDRLVDRKVADLAPARKNRRVDLVEVGPGVLVDE